MAEQQHARPFAAVVIVAVVALGGVAGGGVFGQGTRQREDGMTGPRTEPETKIEGRNRLGDETSPYLLQHAGNPVHWWPWGPEAFAAARAQGKPIFLSVGYSTCYWCHVMERESFENEAIAALMNEHYVSIKVDREERPDVDDIYMMATQILNNGQGGWPMSVFIEPETLKPFLAGTYFPPEDGFGRPGFRSVLTQVADFWENRRDAIRAQADRIAQIVADELSRQPAARPVGAGLIDTGVARLLSTYDAEHGGFGRQQKFPTPVNLDFLMAAAWEQPAARAAVRHTLDRMATGGLHDQIGGGFHRYTVDERWQVPHFEKMLYDNAQLARTYAEAHARTGDAYYARVVRDTLDYVQREMTAPSGAFLSAQDAEVEHREGGNYVWTPDEIRASLGAAGLDADVEFTLRIYGFEDGPNFRDPHHPEDAPKYVVHLTDRPDALATELGMDVAAFEARRDRVNRALLAARDERPQPITDDKVLAGWNGLMIAGFADGGRVLREPRYVEAAERAARAILDTMWSADTGLLRRSYRDGHARIEGFLTDYANMACGLLALHRATGDARHLDEARRLVAAARARFRDPVQGGWFDTRPGQEDLFVRVKSTHDGAVPSGNGVMLLTLIDLHEATGDDAYLDDALETIASLSAVVASRPTSAMMTMIGLRRLLDLAPERVAAIGGATPPAPPPAPVRVGVSPAEVRLGGDGAERIDVTLDVAEGYHVTAREPGQEMLIPLDVQIVGATGVSASAAYPEGEGFDGAGGLMYVHHGRVVVPVTLRRTGAIDGTPKLMLTYQVCTDEYCLAPESVELPVRIESAP